MSVLDQGGKAGADITLGALLEGFMPAAQLEADAALPITDLVQDNRLVTEGCLFVASQGFNTHGLVYASDAVAKGAVAVIWDGDCDRREEILDQISNKVVCVHCPGLKDHVGEIASRFYSYPSREMDVVGITGTDGKTSIAHFLAQALDAYDVHCGVMGTLGNGFINDLHPTGLTTVDSLQVQKTLAEMRDAGSQHVVMEVSSHGLDQGRVNGVEFNTAIFSNLAQDHLDYHETLEAYGAAKKKLFFMPGLRTAVINLDDAFGRELATACRGHLGVWGYSTKADVSDLSEYADQIVHCTAFEPDSDGLKIDVVTPKGRCRLVIGLMGVFNVSNMLAVLSALLVNGSTFESACQHMQMIRAVSGRMQKVEIDNKDCPAVIIDYAHTPQALEAACRSVRDHFSKRFWCVFGCGGERDAGKRPLMAAAAQEFADHVVVTSDNPRHEDPDVIISQIVSGFTDASKYNIEPDRKKAIAYAITHARPGDVVLVAGKGHESSQLIGDVHIAFNDYRVAKEIAEARG